MASATSAGPRPRGPVDGSCALCGLFRQLAGPLFLPILAQGMGQTMAMAVLPIILSSLGASVAEIGLVVSLRKLGMFLSSVAVGMVVDAVGVRASIGVALATWCGLSAARVYAARLWLFAVCALLEGVCNTLINIAKQWCIGDAVPRAFRGRLAGGMNVCLRGSMALGPPLASALILAAGTSRGAYSGQTAMFAAALLLFIASHAVMDLRARSSASRDLEEARTLAASSSTGGAAAGSTASTPAAPPSPTSSAAADPGGGDDDSERGGAARAEEAGVDDVGGSTWSRLSRVAIPLVCIVFNNTTRELLLPLAAMAAGLSGVTTGLMLGMVLLLDTLTVPLSAALMDGVGRKASGVPCFILLGAGYCLLAISASPRGLWLSAAVLGAGNGLGGGLQTTLAADVSPPEARGKFLGVVKMMTGCAGFLGPLVCAACAQRWSLAAGCAFAAAVSIGSGLWYALIGQETLVNSAARTSPTSMAAAGCSSGPASGDFCEAASTGLQSVLGRSVWTPEGRRAPDSMGNCEAETTRSSSSSDDDGHGDDECELARQPRPQQEMPQQDAAAAAAAPPETAMRPSVTETAITYRSQQQL